MMTYASPTVGSEMTRSAFLAVSKSSRRNAVSKINVQVHHLAELLLRDSALPPRPSSQSPRKAYQACPTAKRFMCTDCRRFPRNTLIASLVFEGLYDISGYSAAWAAWQTQKPEDGNNEELPDLPLVRSREQSLTEIQ